MDLSLSLLMLVMILPLMLIVMFCLYYANDKAGVFFFQNRVGLDCKIFKIIKFKSMTDARDSQGNLLPNKERLTKIGKFIRKTSIDELPQLINVLKGDMSLIGPRPLPVEYLPLYTTEQKKRHYVKPGITGWAQVNGRNFLPFSKRFELDVWYVGHLSFKLDVKIVMMSIKNVLFRKDISMDKHIASEDDLGFLNVIRKNKDI